MNQTESLENMQTNISNVENLNVILQEKIDNTPSKKKKIIIIITIVILIIIIALLIIFITYKKNQILQEQHQFLLMLSFLI